MKLKDRYSPGTVVGEFEGRPIQSYYANCPYCGGTSFTTRSVADADQDAEIEVCQRCFKVKKVSVLG